MGEKIEKSRHVESSTEDSPNHLTGHGLAAIAAASEDEPQTPYQLGWRTVLALLALSMANVCAALSNTVSNIQIRYNFWLIDGSDKHNHQVPSCNTS